MKTKQLQKHEEDYLHITKRSFNYFLLTLLLAVVNIFWFVALNMQLKTLDIYTLLEVSSEYTNSSLTQLSIIPDLIFTYILFSLLILSFVSIFKKLKTFDEGGLVVGLVGGLVVGLVGGLVVEFE